MMFNSPVLQTVGFAAAVLT